MMNAKQQQQYEIVGYSSKLFRDVTAAAYCHDEKQLHPHELDPYCTIDRFDVRGLLEFPIDYKRATTQVDGGSKLDERELLHKWRFGDFDDHRDHDDEHRKLLDEIEHEEKSKTSNGKFGAVGFDYDNGNNEEGEVKKENEENDKPYQVPADLKSLPKNVQLPQYQREHDIIEKTAEFLATQSIQMEILLKTKQSANDKFIFLDFGAELNDYYKFIKQAIKSGAYTAKKEPKKDYQSDSDSDSDSSGCYLHPSLLAGRAKQQQQPVAIEPEKPKIDENHPLFKIMKSRREAEEQKNQKKQDELEAQKEANSTKITVPPPDVCQTVTWTAQFLAKMDSVARVSETQRLLELNPSLSFLRGADIFHNYYKTILERTLMAQIGGGAGGHSPPPTPSHTTIAYHQIEGKPISFQINSKNDTTTPTSKPLDQADINEKLRKAQEVAQRIGAQREIEQKMQRRLKENLHGVNQRVRQAEEHLRSQHDASLAMRQSAQLISQGIVPPPPSGAPDSDGSDDSDDRARNRRSRSRERSRRRRSRSRDRRRSRSRKRSRRPERKSRRKRTRRSRSKS